MSKLRLVRLIGVLGPLALASLGSMLRAAATRAWTLPLTLGSGLSQLSPDARAPVSFHRDDLADYRSELLSLLEGPRRRLWILRGALVLLGALTLGAGTIVLVL